MSFTSNKEAVKYSDEKKVKCSKLKKLVEFYTKKLLI